MDIKDLSKSQLLMLAVLLSFVVSIATGITTVTLMQQAPSSITTPINRVIRQTVEKIQQVEGKTTVETVVIKEEDLVVDAISKNQSSVFEASKEVEVGGDKIEVGAGSGFLISDKKIIAVDGLLVPDQGNYFVKNASGKFKADLVGRGEGFSFLKIGDAIIPGNAVLSSNVPVFGDLGNTKVGQKMMVLGRPIYSFIYDGNKSMTSNISRSNAGALVINLDGEALGMTLSGEENVFVSINVLVEALKNVPQ